MGYTRQLTGKQLKYDIVQEINAIIKNLDNDVYSHQKLGALQLRVKRMKQLNPSLIHSLYDCDMMIEKVKEMMKYY